MQTSAVLLSQESSSGEINRNTCPKHQSETYKLFCEDCSKLKCSLCYALDRKLHDAHIKHQILSVEVAAKRKRKNISNMCDLVRVNYPEIDKIIEMKKKSIESKKRAIAQLQLEVDEMKADIPKKACKKRRNGVECTRS